MDEPFKWLIVKSYSKFLFVFQGVKKDVNVKTHDNKKELPALTVFSLAIRYLKDHLLTALNKSSTGIGILESDIQWVLTVPAIWNDSAKQFMRKAAKKVRTAEISSTFELQWLDNYVHVT